MRHSNTCFQVFTIMLKSSFLLVTALLAIVPAAQAVSIYDNSDFKIAQTTSDKLTTLGADLISQSSQTDFLVSEGRDGYTDPRTQRGFDFYYKLFQKRNSSWYEIYIWTLEDYTNQSGYIFRRQFPSSGEALDYFDCVFGDKDLKTCSSFGVRAKYTY